MQKRNVFNYYLNKFKIHIICWALFICYEVLFVVSLTGQPTPFLDYLYHYIINIAFFYVHSYYTYPLIVKKGTSLKYVLILPLILLELGIYLGVMVLITYILNITIHKSIDFNKIYFLRYIWRGIYFLFFGTGFYYLRSALANQILVSKLEKEKVDNQLQQQLLENRLIKSENAWRQSQLNPHFLFNTLNLIYNKVNALSPKVGDSIMMLSEIMRFSITPLSNHGKIKLSDEIEHIHLFIKLNQLRFDDKLTLNFEVNSDDENESLLINPLLLITLVENVFKYGDLYNEANPSFIIINVADGGLNFSTKNQINKREVASHGIGLNNVTERLKLYYPNQHTFNYKDENSIFYLNLTINLNNNDNLLHN
jgi:two-component system LytT family sensor kinase